MRIGVTSDIIFSQDEPFRQREGHFAQRTLMNCLLANDITPVIFPVGKPHMAHDLLETVDGLIMTGGPDVLPKYYGEEPIEQIGRTFETRDEFELALVQQAIAMKKPILAICRGLQIVNVAMGGTLYQDLSSQFKPTNGSPLLQHEQKAIGYSPVHHITIDEKSELAKTFGTRAFVNSFHHEAAKDVADGLHVVARADDGTIEAMENDDLTIQCIQWHPENMWDHYEDENQLFVDFFNRVHQ
ncbi:MAG: gamma-glutamyl-gamma-aminobutyrate hydrolase family protein [Apilactobacillus sp.]|uniref:gamma-glutamyl-gamma-aminobutyrate hydrolase family protein n=1 Tax=Apilactobacillus sp. TaxID=2767901 RepID=UPI0025CCA7D7|nr:gamma-glutamyl-gamma-aminobutyrate hydrolase family protein [Apilactobacillus sp.]MCT6822935.1 gamma-glutamyl-gamma-aminobutyrate hydrolase family protein [Apilactobacillus sp.]MCT6858011.1 gamma-glutamyl-gamma-aminobutyrate hydrolase family protein [Apilactobacillus sp.]